MSAPGRVTVGHAPRAYPGDMTPAQVAALQAEIAEACGQRTR